MAQGTTEPASAPSADVLQVQHQIRANASELQDYFADLYSWEKTINKEERERNNTANKSSNVPLPRARTAATVVTTATTPTQTPSAVEKPADAHTYDKGYKKWEKFDVDAALRDEEETVVVSTPRIEELPTVKSTARAVKKVVTAKAKPQPVTGKSREEIEREEGNDHYKRGDYVAAIKSYTRALGFNARNVTVLSNRAMAYLKNREYGKAEDDCSLALKVDDTHVKTYSRRGTARNSLGKHRLALLDFERALELDPKSKQIASQVTATKELMRTAIKRASKRTEFSVKVVGESPPLVQKDASITSVSPPTEDKENAPRSSINRKIEIVDDSSSLAPVDQPQGKAVLKTQEPPSTPAPVPPPAPPIKAKNQSTPSVGAPLPKLPTKAPTTSYEFLRVWKTLALKKGGNNVSSRNQKLLELRGDYLRLLPAASLASVFKNSIESEILCEIFAVIRRAFDIVNADRAFAIELVSQLPRVPRFSMTVMFLSDAEKTDLIWVLEQLSQSEENDSGLMNKLRELKPLYGLK